MDRKSGPKYVRQVTWIGLVINLMLSGFKFAAGIIGSSQAVVADAIHSLTDGITDVVVIVGSHFWAKPPDTNHQHGHHRIETVITVFIGIVLFIAGIGIAWRAITTLHEKHAIAPGWIAALAAAISIILKEVLYRWTAQVGKRLKSSALTANAWHHRLDAISSIPTLIAVSAAIIFPTWSFLDHVGAVIVSILIIQAAITIIWPALREFMDIAAPERICRQIIAICLENDAVLQVHRVRTRYIGMSIQADLHVLVDGAMTVSTGHHVAGEVKNKILSEIPDVIDVLIHIEPSDLIVSAEKC